MRSPNAKKTPLSSSPAFRETPLSLWISKRTARQRVFQAAAVSIHKESSAHIISESTIEVVLSIEHSTRYISSLHVKIPV